MQASDREPLWTRAFVFAWIANFMHSVGFHSYVHWPGWLEGRGAGEVLIGVLVAVMAVAAILARPFVGRMMDTRGRKLVMIVGGLIHVASSALYLVVDAVPGAGWGAIAGVRVVHGFAQAAMFSVLFTVAADLVPASRRAHGIALFGVSGMIPMAVGGLLGDFVIVDGDYRPLFVVSGACALAGLLVSLPLPETRRGGPSRSFFAAAAAPELRPLWFVGCCFAMGLAAYFVFLKTYLLEAPKLGTMGMFFTTYAIAAVLLRVFFGWVPERFGLNRVLIPSLLMGALGLGLIACATGEIHLISAAILCGVGHGFAFPIISALVVMRAGPDERGSAIALFTALFDLGVLFGGPLFGICAKYAGYPATFALAAGLVATATFVFVIWDRSQRSTPPGVEILEG
ncbi:major facilitator superfamily transporter [Enhygromyxa salina]|uniref:Major facilitator superfamily transporter n=1 Tax=Enhygromyxa salina TaxID=215803 RepID=A0A2S9XUW4_9BACT|nr:MFS transporter [Enhygromyxa salina]PRP96501.1 major facilitator superfamily transporter [Enhygromyxa salina]